MFEKMLDEMIRMFGFEDERVIEFATLIEDADEFDCYDRDYVECNYLVLTTVRV